MVSKLLANAFDLFLQEIEEDVHIIKEILKYHGRSIIEDFHSNTKKKILRKKMKKTHDYKEWKSLARSFDKLPGIYIPLNLYEIIKTVFRNKIL